MITSIRSTSSVLWSDGPLPPHQVILSPTRPKRITARYGDLLLAVFTSLTTISNLGSILHNGRSIRIKWELFKAEYSLNRLLVIGSPLFWYLLGFRLANCECAFGLGHRHAEGAHRPASV